MNATETKTDGFSDLAGLTLAAINVRRSNADSRYRDQDSIEFIATNGDRFVMTHQRECCECVQIEDICGDLNDLIGLPLYLAEEVSSPNTIPEGLSNPSDRLPWNDGYGSYPDTFTWTFYKLATIKGAVTIRWYGESNGYYSEKVDFGRLR